MTIEEQTQPDQPPAGRITKHPRGLRWHVGDIVVRDFYRSKPRTAECAACAWKVSESDLREARERVAAEYPQHKNLVRMSGYWMEAQDVLDHVHWLDAGYPG
jgi:hypothetical protein